MADMLPELPLANTACMRFALEGQGALDTLRQYESRARAAGYDDIADEIAIARARVYRVLASRLQEQQP